MAIKELITLEGVQEVEAQDKAEAAVIRMIDAVQANWLSDYERKLIDHDCDAADLAAAIDRLRAEHVHLRERAIEKMRAMVACGEKGLQ